MGSNDVLGVLVFPENTQPYEDFYDTCISKIYQTGLKDSRRLSNIFSRDGISTKVLDIILDTPPSDMRWIDREEAKILGLVNQ